MKCRFTTTKAKMKAIESVVSSLALNLVYRVETQLGWSMVFCIASGIRPAVAASIVAESTQQPTDCK